MDIVDELTVAHVPPGEAREPWLHATMTRAAEEIVRLRGEVAKLALLLPACAGATKTETAAARAEARDRFDAARQRRRKALLDAGVRPWF